MSNPPSTLTTAEALAQGMKRAGFSAVFGIPGVHNMHLYEALRRLGDIRLVVSRHEQGAGYMADGFARTTGGIGVALVVTGPGATNILTPVAVAHADSSPVLVVASQVERRYLGQERGLMHEFRDQMGAFASHTAWSYRLMDPADAQWALRRALERLQAERPRPVYLEIPLDVLHGQGATPPRPLTPIHRPGPDPGAVAAIAERLRQAERPVLLAGIGVVRAGGELALRAVAEALGAPVLTTVQARGALPSQHPLHLGSYWTREIFRDSILNEADAVLAVGTRLSARTWVSGRLPLPPALFQVDLDAAEIGRSVDLERGVVADARLFLEALAAELQGLNHGGREWALEAVRRHRRRVEAGLAERLGSVYPYFLALREALPSHGILATETSGFGIWLAKYFPCDLPRRFLYPMASGTLGFALPAAVGAAVAEPSTPVVALAGDGGILFNVGELATARGEGLNLVTVVFNDRGYGTVRMSQRQAFSGQTVGVDLWTPDFVKLGESFGIPAVVVDTAEDFHAALQKAIASGGPHLIEVIQPEMPSPF